MCWFWNKRTGWIVSLSYSKRYISWLVNIACILSVHFILLIYYFVSSSFLSFFRRLSYSVLYHGFYEQGKQRAINTRLPVGPFELFFEEIVLDTGEDGNGISCHRITGKGADLVGPYSLRGKSLGNKVSINKTYHHYHGSEATDSGHVVRIRLSRLDNTQILDGTYSVKTAEVQTSGMYQIWPVGYDKENNVLPVPPETPIEDMPVDIENQQPEPLPEVVVAVATSNSDNTDGNAPVVAVATATAL